MLDRDWLDGLIEVELKRRWRGAYDCDDPYDDCEQWVNDDRKTLRDAALQEMPDFVERMMRHANRDDDVARALESLANAILAAAEPPTLESES